MGREGHALTEPKKAALTAPTVPFPRRARRAFDTAWPLVAWFAAIGGAAWLYPRAESHGEAYAWAESVEVGITPSIAGRVARDDLEIGQEVRAGDLVATLDASDLDERIRVARAAPEQPADGSAMRRVELVDRKGLASLRLASDSGSDQRIRLEVDRITAEQSTDRGELAALVPEIARIQDLVDKHLAIPDRLDGLVVRRALIEKRITARDAEKSRLLERASAGAGNTLKLEEMQVSELERQRAKYQLAAPAGGRIEAVLHRPGEWVEAGTSIAQIVVPRPGRMTAYVADRQAVDVHVGETVTLRARAHAGPALEGKVIALGPRIDEVPVRLRLVPTVVQWGRPVTIEIDRSIEVLPGEVYSARFHP